MEKNISKKVMIFAVLLGLLCSLILCVQRYHIEERSKTIEQALDYDAVVRMARSDGYDNETMFKMVREAGITSFTMYDTTLNKLAQRGDISIITNLMARLYYPQLHIQDYSYDYYVIGKPKAEKDLYFDEVVSDLGIRLHPRNVANLSNGEYRIAGIRGIMPEIGEVNLGILSADVNYVAAHGFFAVLRPTNYGEPTSAEVQHFFARMDKMQHVSGMMFVGKDVLGYHHDVNKMRPLLAYTAQQMKQRTCPFYMIEATGQLQYDPQAGMYELAALLDHRTVRAYAMSKEELEKIAPGEATMRYYISDLERNVRFNLYPLYKKPLQGQNLTETNLSYISNVSKKLQQRGYHLGRASVMPAYYPTRLLLAIAALGACSGFLWLLNLLLPLSERVNRRLLPLAAAIGVAGSLAVHGAWFLQLLALVCAVSAPVIAILLVVKQLKQYSCQEVHTYKKIICIGIISLTVAVLFSLVGGIYIAGMLGNIRFFMEFDFYRGVKVTFILPLLLVIWGYLRVFPLHGYRLSTWQETKKLCQYVLNVPIRMQTLGIIGVLVIGAYIFLGRSGHTAGVPVPGFEVAMRRFLESVMYARPREKEFLIGYPAFFLMVTAIYRQWPSLFQFFMVVGATIGLGSMVETFAHIRTPFLMSLLRGVDGWFVGVFIGVAVVIVLALLHQGKIWIGKRVDDGT
ncbi:DUF5693 family protein [Megasphaera sp. UPII 135-E]|uniref:DUF5693 family protein n=1 Tax=Megasphaera sp. UPII 135-E TaxID=1000569 RepID=UPI00021A1FFB|nr:DUF5693 family protein [Megasphaera sp. UPII 135-E]EGS33916.1 conserved domain protein [Megasphaera sp. UPII 135-E]